LNVSNRELKFEYGFCNTAPGIHDGNIWLAAQVVDSRRPPLVIFGYVAVYEVFRDLSVVEVVDFVCVAGNFNRRVRSMPGEKLLTGEVYRRGSAILTLL
jgi:hypothetical protein